jgi:hypothetical protein
VLDPKLLPYLVTSSGECEVPCIDGACNDAFDVCQDGFCSPNICGQPPAFDGGIYASGIWEPCDAGGSLDGTCIFVPNVLANDQNTFLNSFYCVQGGTSDGGCDPAATRASPGGDRCLPGLTCVQSFPGDAGCVQRCDQSILPSTCAAGLECASGNPAENAVFAICYPIGAGGCPMGLPTAPSQLCASAIDCGCPFQCIANAHLGATVCEAPCQTTADCPYDDDHCQDGFCEVNFCQADQLGQPVPGEFDGTCPLDDGGLGTCIPFGQIAIDSTTPEFGVCLRTGGATVACTNPFSESSPVNALVDLGLPLDSSQLCPLGQVCAGGACAAVCNPILDAGVDAGCSSPQACLEQNGDPVTHFGVCGPCIAQGGNCSLPGDCCSGDCRGTCH